MEIILSCYSIIIAAYNRVSFYSSNLNGCKIELRIHVMPLSELTHWKCAHQSLAQSKEFHRDDNNNHRYDEHKRQKKNGMQTQFS